MKFKQLLIAVIFLLAFSFATRATPYHWQCGTFTIDATDTLVYCPQISTNYIYCTITNTGTSDIYVRQIINTTNLPAGWSFNMCNPNGCWGPNVLIDTFLVPGSGSVIARFDFHSDTTIGTGVTSVRFDDSANPTVNGATFNLHAASLTPLSVSVFANDTVICAGETIFLSAIAAGGDGNYYYSWTPNIGSSPGPLPATPLATTTFLVIVTDGIGTPAAMASVVVTVNPMPFAYFGSDFQYGCVPLNTCFSDLSLIGAGGTITQWLWDFGDGSPADTNDNPCHVYSVPSAPNLYSVTLTTTSNAGCSSSSTINNYIAAYPIPMAAFTATPQYVLLNQAVQFNNISNGATSWYWDFGDSYQDTAQNPLHYYSDPPGNYLACLTVLNVYACIDTTCDSIYVVTGINEAQKENNSLLLYPNPVISELRIQNAEFRIKSLEIYSVSGQRIFSQPQTSNFKLQTIDISQLPAGIYFVKVRGESGVRMGKFVKE